MDEGYTLMKVALEGAELERAEKNAAVLGIRVEDWIHFMVTWRAFGIGALCPTEEEVKGKVVRIIHEDGTAEDVH